MYQLKEIQDKNTWNSFVTENNFEFYSFLSSWEWGEFKKEFGFPVLRYGIYKNNELIGILPLIKTIAKRGTYLFAPHTPLILENNKYFDILKEILPQLKNIAKENNASFIRFNAPIKAEFGNYKKLKEIGFKPSPIHEHAEETHLLDLTKSEEDLFKQIKKKDRYYINRAIKEGVKVRIDNNPDHIELLIKMHIQHSKKVGYHPFSEKYIKNLYKHFGDNIRTISTWYNNELESILMTIKFGNTCVYYIAASDIKNKKFSPNYLCQREAIKQAKKDGAKIYNFWGVAPDNNPKHPLAGVSGFKRKWGGYDYFLVHAHDLPISQKYWITWLIETGRRIKRGYYYNIPKV